jgi:YhcH/YjgK/YiaL family protein
MMMIVDTLKNASMYNVFGKNFEAAFKWLKSNDLKNMPVGKVEIDGTNVYANIMEVDSKTAAQGKWESHKVYADIQFLIDGAEKIGYADISRTSQVSHDEAKDFVTLSAEGDFFVRLHPDSFVIVFPHDAHLPGIAAIEGSSSKIKKVVIKVRL